jgi:ABC-type enterochelin transport system permease subunit
MYLLGVLIAIGAAVAFAVVGALTLWGGLVTFTSELPRDYRRSAATPAQRALTLALVGLPLVITALFGLLAAGRILQVALGLG